MYVGAGAGELVLLILNIVDVIFLLEPSLWKLVGLPGELKTDVMLLQRQFQQSEQSNMEPYGFKLS